MSVETLEFQTEQKQLMDIIIHSLYSHPEIFLRELISNACDAIDKVRFEGLTNEKILENNNEWKIKIIADKENNTLTISDNGIGMSKESIIENLGTIARSGTKAFLEQLKKSEDKKSPDLIGQFGVGFYSCFMVADKVTVTSRMAGDSKNGIKWESEGKGSYTLEEVSKETRGTDITLHLNEEGKKFLEEWTIRNIVKRYSDYIEHPVVMDVEREEGEGDDKKNVIKEETLNSQKAIWLRSKDEIEKEQYSEFYKHISHDFCDPAEIIHYKAEGTLEFSALLFIPEKKPMDMFGTPDPKSSLHLYVNRVQIMDNCEKLLPPYMRFIKGVVDSSDLPLNVSREMLQENLILNKIQNNLVKKVISTLSTMKEKENEKYLTFYKEFNHNIKEGLATDFSNREKLAELLMFESTMTEPGKMTNLSDYIERMKDDQEYIYFLIGEDRVKMDKSPYLEIFKDKGHEVLLMTDPIDEWALQSVPEFKGKKFKSVDKGEIKQSDKEKEEMESKENDYKDLLAFIKEKLGDEIKDARLSGRLKESAAVLVADDSDLSANMERIMKTIGGKQGDMYNSKRILEINPDHESVKSVLATFNKDKENASDFIWLLYDQALIAEGSQIKDATGFMTRINNLMAKACN